MSYEFSGLPILRSNLLSWGGLNFDGMASGLDAKIELPFYLAWLEMFNPSKLALLTSSSISSTMHWSYVSSLLLSML